MLLVSLSNGVFSAETAPSSPQQASVERSASSPDSSWLWWIGGIALAMICGPLVTLKMTSRTSASNRNNSSTKRQQHQQDNLDPPNPLPITPDTMISGTLAAGGMTALSASTLPDADPDTAQCRPTAKDSQDIDQCPNDDWESDSSANSDSDSGSSSDSSSSDD
ncbi:hypothetical protein [Chitinivorax sp. B]|uniref:hypothetical protein n=1 Tax=Chitinivorax sp. B TaxID=2502235 RepID=UPI0010F79C06|nr:hypothetical protein [Chitinivorax sp. B]